MEPIGRRQFLTGTAMLGARALLPWHEAEAQMSTAKPHRIDVHHHHTPPPYLAAITARNIPGPVRDWTPEKSIADMDKAGVATSVTSITTPALRFLDEAGARRGPPGGPEDNAQRGAARGGAAGAPP